MFLQWKKVPTHIPSSKVNWIKLSIIQMPVGLKLFSLAKVWRNSINKPDHCEGCHMNPCEKMPLGWEQVLCVASFSKIQENEKMFGLLFLPVHPSTRFFRKK